MFFKDSSDFHIKDLGDTLTTKGSITLESSLILGGILFLILTLLVYPNFLTNSVLQILLHSIY